MNDLITRSRRNRTRALLVFALTAAAFAMPPKAAAAAALLCPDSVFIDSCNNIPPELENQCQACGRPVICHSVYPPYGNYTIAGCVFDE